MYVAVLVACSFYHCYRMGLYSQQEFATREDCLNSFGFVAATFHPKDTHLRVRCMSKEEWALMPTYPKGGPR